MKYVHEFRDPVHDFIEVKSHERTIIDSRPVQRLRHISQLALTNLVYPGATHRRFEHSLGVMHLAGQAFDVLTDDQNLSDGVRDLLQPLSAKDHLPYWRSVVRMAALCHDLGHLPFSHAAEHEVLPSGYSHERISSDIIRSSELDSIFSHLEVPIKSEVVAKLAVGPKEFTRATKDKAVAEFSVWEAILCEIVTGNAFGVDRMDYLLRDSLHAGVAYGRFDHRRLIQSLRLLVPPDEKAPTVGIDFGGIHAAEALLSARYHMFAQLYFHRVRVAYDIHLIDFLQEWLPGGTFSVDVEDHLNMTDNEVWVGIREASLDASAPGHDAAWRIWNRKHFKSLYIASPEDQRILRNPAAAIAAWASNEFGEHNIRFKHSSKPGGTVDFPVRLDNGSIASSLAVSESINRLPTNSADLVFINPDVLAAARTRLTNEKVAEILHAVAAAQTDEEDTEASEMKITTPEDKAKEQS